MNNSKYEPQKIFMFEILSISVFILNITISTSKKQLSQGRIGAESPGEVQQTLKV